MNPIEATSMASRCVVVCSAPGPPSMRRCSGGRSRSGRNKEQQSENEGQDDEAEPRVDGETHRVLTSGSPLVNCLPALAERATCFAILSMEGRRSSTV